MPDTDKLKKYIPKIVTITLVVVALCFALLLACMIKRTSRSQKKISPIF